MLIFKESSLFHNFSVDHFVFEVYNPSIICLVCGSVSFPIGPLALNNPFLRNKKSHFQDPIRFTP